MLILVCLWLIMLFIEYFVICDVLVSFYFIFLCGMIRFFNLVWFPCFLFLSLHFVLSLWRINIRINVRTKFEVRSITRSWDNMVLQKFGQSLYTPTLHFLHNFNELLFGSNLWMYRPNLKSVALPVPEIIAIKVGGGWYRSKERWWVPIIYLYNI